MRQLFTACAVLIACLGVPAAAQTLSFLLDRSGELPARFAIRLDLSSGHGLYRADRPIGESGAPRDSHTEEVPVTVGAPMLKKLLSAMPSVESGHCETRNKKVAQTGMKTLRLQQNGQTFTCIFNYSDDDRVNAASSLFEAIGETMQFGDRLAAKLRFDRLGLDGEMDNLQSALADGRAVEVSNIFPVLQAIANDDRVMDRVRRKVERILQTTGVSAKNDVSALAWSDR